MTSHPCRCYENNAFIDLILNRFGTLRNTQVP